MSRGIEVRGSFRTQGVPRALGWAAGKFQFREGLPGADIKNTGGRKAGSITAAMFLREFVDKKPWAHIDMAGVDTYEHDKGWITKGASGMPVRTLVHTLAKSVGEGSPDPIVHWSRMVRHAHALPVVLAMIDTVCEIAEELAHAFHGDLGTIVVFLEIVKTRTHAAPAGSSALSMKLPLPMPMYSRPPANVAPPHTGRSVGRRHFSWPVAASRQKTHVVW